MAIAKLSLVNIIGELDRLDDVIIRCLDRGGFHPESAIQTAGEHGFTPLSEDNPYTPLLDRLTNLGISAGLNPRFMPEHVDDEKLARTAHQGVQYYQDFCSQFQKDLELLLAQRNFLKKELEQDENTMIYLHHLVKWDVDFDELFSCKYIKVRFGRLPVGSLEKLDYYRDRPFVFTTFDQERDYLWGGYFTLREDAPEIDDIFASLYFERLRIPEFVHGSPETALERLDTRVQRNAQELRLTEQNLKELVERRREKYYKIYTRVKFLRDSFDLRRYVSVLRRDFVDLFFMTGFIESSQAQAFSEALRQIPGVQVEVKAHDLDQRLTPPTKLKNGWFAKPFEMFVEMYGLPAYGELDPTPFVAFTYCLLFGIMFGDLGQGLLLVLGGWLYWKWKKANIGRVINRVGIFSCIFGTLYGSVFGFEELLTPFYTQVLGLPGKPIEVMAPASTNLILVSAIGLGVALIMICILLDIFTCLRRKDYERALFSANGVAGLVFYGSVLVGAVSTLLLGTNLFTLPYVLCLILLPLAVILFKEPLGHLLAGKAPFPEGVGAYLSVEFFELFEVVLSFFSNTMSFLRVGGFVLSHAGMMAVVFTLSEMVGSVGSPVVIVVGNLFVMGMEGLIVGIQVLRLEFYELFSRYFDGDGIPFQPASVMAEAQG